MAARVCIRTSANLLVVAMAASQLTTVFVGTYTENPTHGPEFTASPSGAKGIYSAKIDPATGALSDLSLAAEVVISPSWLRAHPKLPVLYSTNETMDGEGAACTPSTISAFRIGPGGKLAFMSSVGTGGGSGCHFSLHPDASHIAVANHG